MDSLDIGSQNFHNYKTKEQEKRDKPDGKKSYKIGIHLIVKMRNRTGIHLIGMKNKMKEEVME